MTNENDDCVIDFGKKVRNLRTQKKISQEEFANLAGVHRTYIGGIERGERNITLTTIYKLAKALGIEPYKLLLKEQE